MAAYLIHTITLSKRDLKNRELNKGTQTHAQLHALRWHVPSRKSPRPMRLRAPPEPPTPVAAPVAAAPSQKSKCTFWQKGAAQAHTLGNRTPPVGTAQPGRASAHLGLRPKPPAPAAARIAAARLNLWQRRVRHLLRVGRGVKVLCAATCRAHRVCISGSYVAARTESASVGRMLPFSPQ
eukprot:14275-Chlamydomonas_euryale.AAC.1